MNKKSLLSIFMLMCVIALTACTGNDAKKLLLGDTDKYHNTPKQAVEELFNTLPSQGNILRLKEAVKFKENDKLSDYQKNFKVKAKKERTHGDYKNVTCDITLPDGSTVEKKFRLIKEDDIWKTEIGFSEIRDAIFK